MNYKALNNYETLFCQIAFEALCAEYSIETKYEIFKKSKPEAIREASYFDHQADPIERIILHSGGWGAKLYINIEQVTELTSKEHMITLNWDRRDVGSKFVSSVHGRVKQDCKADYENFVDLVIDLFDEQKNPQAMLRFIDKTGVSYPDWANQMLLKSIAYYRQRIVLERKIINSELFNLANNFQLIVDVPDQKKSLSEGFETYIAETINTPFGDLVKQLGFFEVPKARKKVKRDDWGYSFSTDGEKVYYLDKYELEGADPAKLFFYKDPQKQVEKYCGDGEAVWFAEERIADADGASFHSLGGYFGADKNHVWYKETLLPDADPASFEYGFFQTLGRDAKGIYAGTIPFPKVNPAKFTRIKESDFYHDGERVYYYSHSNYGDSTVLLVDEGIAGDVKLYDVPWACSGLRNNLIATEERVYFKGYGSFDRASFKHGNYYAWDKEHLCFCESDKLLEVDVPIENFSLLTEWIVRSGDSLYYQNKKIDGVDVDTVVVVDDQIIADKNSVWEYGRIEEGVDPQEYLRANKERDFYVWAYIENDERATLRKAPESLVPVLPQLKRGESIGDRFPEGLTLQLDSDSGDKIADAIPTEENGVLFVSQKLREGIEAHCDAVEFYPISLIAPNGRAVDEPYFIANILAVSRCVDRHNSQYEPSGKRDKGKPIDSFEELYLDTDRIDYDLKLFRAEEKRDLILVVAESALDLVKERECTGFMLSLADGWEGEEGIIEE